LIGDIGHTEQVAAIKGFGSDKVREICEIGERELLAGKDINDVKMLVKTLRQAAMDAVAPSGGSGATEAASEQPSE
jgi:hypothetical protein